MSAPPADDAICDDLPSDDLASGDLASDDLASGDLTSDDLASGDLTSDDLASGDLTSDDLASGDLTSGDPASDDLAATLAFFMEIDRLKSIERRNWLADGSRRENTAEHSWHLGMATAMFAPFAAEPIDVSTAMCMSLVHDIVEIDAGDTFAYDEGDAAASKAQREQAAATRLYGMLPAATGERFRALWDQYERGDTPEARYVMAVDRLAPMLLNLAEGGSTWREHGITATRVVARNGSHIELAMPAVWRRAEALLNAAVADGRLSAG